MPKQIKLPDGRIAEFPDNMPTEQIERVLRRQVPPTHPIQQILDRQQVPDNIKADAWDAFHQASSPDDFQQRFDKINLPKDAKADLWDLKFGAPKGESAPHQSAQSSLDTTAAKIGTFIPDWAVGPLQTAQKYLVDPFEALASKGAQEGREFASNVAGAAEEITHPGRFLASPIPGIGAPVMGPVPPAEDPSKVAEREHPLATGVAHGIGATAGGMLADPRNWPFLAKSVAQPVLRKLISAGFSGMMGQSTLAGATQLHDHWDELSPSQRAEIGTQTGLSALLTLGAVHGVIEGVHPAEAESLKINPTEQIHTSDRPQATPLTERGDLAPRKQSEQPSSDQGEEVRPAQTVSPAAHKGSQDARNVADLLAASERPEAPQNAEQIASDRDRFLSMTRRYSGEDALGPSSPMAQLANRVDEVLKQGPPVDRRFTRAEIAADSLTSSSDSAAQKVLNTLVAHSRAAMDILTRPPEDTDFEHAKGRYAGGLSRTKYETNSFAREIKQEIPAKVRREGVTNWIQAGGDEHTLKAWADQTTDKQLKRGYLAALDLTDDEKNLANNIRSYFGMMLQDARANEMLDRGRENYVNQIWQKQSKGVGSNFQPNPSFIKQRVYENFFAGEQSGLTPRTKDIAELVGIYHRSYGSALASRAFISDIGNAKAEDGRPIVVPSGMGRVIEGENNGSIFVKPFGVKGEFDDYRVIDKAPFRKWKFATSTPEGRPVLVQGDMYVHPDYYDRVKNLFEPSRIRESKVGRAALNVSSVLKNTLLIGPFHAVQEGRRALQYGINPFDPGPVDLGKPALKQLTDAGLTLSGDGLQNFAEGVYGDGGLLRKVPVLNRAIHEIGSFTFDHYIPRLKAAAGEKVFEENKARYQKQLDEGKISEFQLARATAEQVNATFGGLNYIMLDRSRTAQDILRLTLLAPDFLEGTGRAVAQAFTRYGGAQRKAILGYGILGSWVMYRVLNQLMSNDPHFEKPFAVVHGDQQYSLRGFGEDLGHLMENPRQFLYHRVNPTTIRPAVQLATGRDEYGRARSLGEQIEDYIKSVTPIPAQSALTRLFDPGDREQSIADSIFTSIGLNKFKYSSPATDLARKLYYDTHTMMADNPESREVGRIRAEVQEGKLSTKDLVQMVRDRKLAPQQAQRIVADKDRTELDYFASQLRLDQIVRVWDKGTPDEQKQLRGVLMRKIGELKTYDDKKRKVLIGAIRERLTKNNVK